MCWVSRCHGYALESRITNHYANTPRAAQSFNREKRKHVSDDGAAASSLDTISALAAEKGDAQQELL
eukprot:COSAG03_NODE_22737_length_287_cov_1.101064_1_plen_66_part_10